MVGTLFLEGVLNLKIGVDDEDVDVPAVEAPNNPSVEAGATVEEVAVVFGGYT